MHPAALQIIKYLQLREQKESQQICNTTLVCATETTDPLTSQTNSRHR